MPFDLAIVDESGQAGREGNRLDYLPFGVKTVKVQVTGAYAGKLRLHPRRATFPAGGPKTAWSTLMTRTLLACGCTTAARP